MIDRKCQPKDSFSWCTIGQCQTEEGSENRRCDECGVQLREEEDLTPSKVESIRMDLDEHQRRVGQLDERETVRRYDPKKGEGKEEYSMEEESKRPRSRPSVQNCTWLDNKIRLTMDGPWSVLRNK